MYAWPWPLRYGLAVIAVAAAIALRHWLRDLLSAQPLPTFFLATLLVSIFLGLGPGLLATFLSVLSASYFFMEPLDGFKIHNLNDVIRLGTFITLGLSINAIAELMRRAINTVATAERTLAEVRLHSAELRLRLALESAGIGVFEWSVATSEMSLDEQVRAHWGVPAGALVDFESFLKAIHVDDRATVQAAINRAPDSNGSGAFSAEFRVTGVQDGIERWISGTGQTVFQNGRASRFVGASLDRTPHKHAEKALRASEERFRSLTQALPSIVFECDARGANVFTSDRWSHYTGMTPGASLDMGWMQAVHPEDLEISKREWKKALQNGDACQLQHRLRAADGSYRWFMVHALPRRNGGGHIVRWAGSCTDIDDLVRAEAALTNANRHKDEFLAMLAHELRNPLAPIRNAVYALRKSNDDGLATKEMTRSLLTIIERQVDHLVCLVDDLLDVSRVTHGIIHLRRERVDLCEILRHAVDTSQPAIRAAGHQLVVELPSLPVIVDADRVRLGQIFANLLNNAAKYTKNDGQICLEVQHSGNEAVVRVRDNGIGICPDMLPHVFDLFKQGASVEGRTQSGLGIGLTLVRSLVHLHGGRVEARSDGLGRGSEFIVHLPVAMVGQAKPESAREPTSVAPRRVLVIDNDHDVADSFALLLGLFGCEVRTAYDGFASISTLVEFEPEIVLLDLGMPGMNGYETAHRIRELPEGRKILLVAVTGWGQDGDRERTREAGFDLHLTKPASIEAIERLLGRKGDA